jgi:hypothetical protein
MTHTTAFLYGLGCGLLCSIAVLGACSVYLFSIDWPEA